MARRSLVISLAVFSVLGFTLLAGPVERTLGAQAQASVGLDPALLATYRWRSIGPDRGGRSIAVAGVKGQPNIGYFGATGGGLWKTTDRGETWTPVTDGQITSASVGHANMHASHWMQSWNRSTRLLFATRSSTLVGHTATHASQPVQRSSLMSWTRMRGPTTWAGAITAWWRLRADSIVNVTITRMARPPSANGTTQVTRTRYPIKVAADAGR